MRPEQLYLTDIVEAANYIAQFVGGLDRNEFLQDELRKSAVVQKIIVIGEAAKNISGELRDRHPEVLWSNVIKMRDRITHGYFGIDYDIVWDTATQEIPTLQEQIVQILQDEFD
jgi:uncharacterized protein with HEPN domain